MTKKKKKSEIGIVFFVVSEAVLCALSLRPEVDDVAHQPRPGVDAGSALVEALGPSDNGNRWTLDPNALKPSLEIMAKEDLWIYAGGHGKIPCFWSLGPGYDADFNFEALNKFVENKGQYIMRMGERLLEFMQARQQLEWTVQRELWVFLSRFFVRMAMAAMADQPKLHKVCMLLSGAFRPKSILVTDELIELIPFLHEGVQIEVIYFYDQPDSREYWKDWLDAITNELKTRMGTRKFTLSLEQIQSEAFGKSASMAAAAV